MDYAQLVTIAHQVLQKQIKSLLTLDIIHLQVRQFKLNVSQAHTLTQMHRQLANNVMLVLIVIPLAWLLVHLAPQAIIVLLELLNPSLVK